MKTAKLDDMVKGWFIGDFQPTLFKTRDVEVAVKCYSEGDYENEHYHMVATEITVIVSGRVKMNDTIYVQGDIIVIEPMQSTDFHALEKTVTTVVKIPGVLGDKYEGKVND